MTVKETIVIFMVIPCYNEAKKLLYLNYSSIKDLLGITCTDMQVVKPTLRNCK